MLSTNSPLDRIDRPDVVLLTQPRQFDHGERHTLVHDVEGGHHTEPYDAWRLAQKTDTTLKRVVVELSVTLHNRHRDIVHWPAEELQHHETFSEYCQNVFLVPVLGLFNQLRYSDYLLPLEYRILESTGEFLIATVHSDEFRIRESCDHEFCDEEYCEEKRASDSPIFVFLPDECLGDVSYQTRPTSYQSQFLRLAWSVNPRSRVIMTDMASAVVISPPTTDVHSDVVCEPVAINGDLRALRVVVAAYILASLPWDFIVYPSPGDDGIEKLPAGPEPAPTSQRSDEDVLATHTRHSDFDFVCLWQDRRRALQFFRWKEHVLANVNPVIANAGDCLRGATHGFSRLYSDLTSSYPMKDLPAETISHIHATRRPISHEDTINWFLASERFALDLVDDTTKRRSGSWMTRTYKCRISSVDDKIIPQDRSPKLFLKLFDDRFHVMTQPEPNSDILDWWAGFQTAEEFVRAESSAYSRLSFLQGSLIPHYFGAHSLVLPDGHEVFGILMEDIDAPTVAHGAGLLSSEHQLQLARSVRHAVRALHYADVSQHDWHRGQILFKTLAARGGERGIVHCVLVDFAATTQSIDAHGPYAADDFCGALDTLLHADMGEDIVFGAFGAREPWETRSYRLDYSCRHIPLPPDPFKFVYDNVDYL